MGRSSRAVPNGLWEAVRPLGSYFNSVRQPGFGFVSQKPREAGWGAHLACLVLPPQTAPGGIALISQNLMSTSKPAHLRPNGPVPCRLGSFFQVSLAGHGWVRFVKTARKKRGDIRPKGTGSIPVGFVFSARLAVRNWLRIAKPRDIRPNGTVPHPLGPFRRTRIWVRIVKSPQPRDSGCSFLAEGG